MYTAYRLPSDTLTQNSVAKSSSSFHLKLIIYYGTKIKLMTHKTHQRGVTYNLDLIILHTNIQERLSLLRSLNVEQNTRISITNVLKIFINQINLLQCCKLPNRTIFILSAWTPVEPNPNGETHDWIKAKNFFSIFFDKNLESVVALNTCLPSNQDCL